MIENGTLLQERYLIERQIGAGGMGAVYLAVDQRFGSHVAIKETFYKNDELGAAFEREAHLLNSLLHPVLPHVSDFFTERGGHFLVMQFIDGEDLFEVLKREGAFPVKDVLRWTDSLLDALDYLHSHEPPIIHRDIKPQNLKITPRGDVILLDFGLAKLSSEDTQAQLSVFGYSRKYSPLEQIQGTGTDARSDLFALGATAYHLLTGKPPLEALTRASAIVAGNADPLPLASELNDEIPVGVAGVLNSALALNPAQRFASAKAMRQALEHTVKIDFVETVEELPAVSIAVVAGNVVVNSVETEGFPALEAFADEANSLLPQIDDTQRLPIAEISAPSSIPISTPAPELTQTTSVVEMQTKVAPRPNRKKFPLFAAAFAALLASVGLAAGYFIYNANSPIEAKQNPAVVQPEEANIEQTAIAPDATTVEAVEAADAPIAESVEQAEAKPAVIKTTTIEKRAPVEKPKAIEEPAPEPEAKENPKPAPAKVETARSNPAPNKRRAESQNSGETRTRVVKSERAPDIESIFTGRSSEQRDEIQQRKEERRRSREQTSDEELRETRRQRRLERQQRQNNQNFPF